MAELESSKAGCFCWDEPRSPLELIFVPKKTTADEAVRIASHASTIHTLPQLTTHPGSGQGQLVTAAQPRHRRDTPRDGDPVPAAPVAQTNGVEAPFLGVRFGGDGFGDQSWIHGDMSTRVLSLPRILLIVFPGRHVVELESGVFYHASYHLYARGWRPQAGFCVDSAGGMVL